MGITEADGAFDVEGWDSAAKTAALANVLMDARTTPQEVSTRGITRLTPERMQEINAGGKTVRLVSRGRRTASGMSLRVRAEVLERGDMLACTPGTSNLILFHTDLMGTFGTVSIEPGVAQTAYGVFSDLVSLSENRATPPPPPRAAPAIRAAFTEITPSRFCSTPSIIRNGSPSTSNL